MGGPGEERWARGAEKVRLGRRGDSFQGFVDDAALVLLTASSQLPPTPPSLLDRSHYALGGDARTWTADAISNPRWHPSKSPSVWRAAPHTSGAHRLPMRLARRRGVAHRPKVTTLPECPLQLAWPWVLQSPPTVRLGCCIHQRIIRTVGEVSPNPTRLLHPRSPSPWQATRTRPLRLSDRRKETSRRARAQVSISSPRGVSDSSLSATCSNHRLASLPPPLTPTPTLIPIPSPILPHTHTLLLPPTPFLLLPRCSLPRRHTTVL